MNHRVLHFCICAFVVFLIAVPVVSAVEVESPPILKEYVPSTPSDDEHFFEQVTEFMNQLSGQTVASGDDLWFFTLLASGYNIEEHRTAQKLIDFLFYSAKASERYRQYLSNWELRFTPINADSEYTLAQEYVTLAKKTFESCEACTELYPDFEMFTIPEKESGSSASQFTGKLGF